MMQSRWCRCQSREYKGRSGQNDASIFGTGRKERDEPHERGFQRSKDVRRDVRDNCLWRMITDDGDDGRSMTDHSRTMPTVILSGFFKPPHEITNCRTRWFLENSNLEAISWSKGMPDAENESIMRPHSVGKGLFGAPLERKKGFLSHVLTSKFTCSEKRLMIHHDPWKGLARFTYLP